MPEEPGQVGRVSPEGFVCGLGAMLTKMVPKPHTKWVGLTGLGRDGRSVRARTARVHSGGMDTALFETIDHVGIAVADLDEALKLYTGVYGMTVVHTEENAEQGVREAMVAVNGAAPESGPMLQILAPLNESSTIAKFLDRSGPGMQQLAYRVTDIDAVSATLRERGMRLLFDEPKQGTAGSRVNFVHPKDAGGVLVEIVQPAK